MSQSPATRPTRARFGVLALIAIATALNYLDRTLLGVAAPTMTKELGFGPELMGVVFAAFSWSYALAQVPGGVFLDRFGTRITRGWPFSSKKTRTSPSSVVSPTACRRISSCLPASISAVISSPGSMP